MRQGVVLGVTGTSPSPQQRSAAIDIARVIGILGIVYAHSRTGLTNAQLSNQPLNAYSITYWLLVEMLGRSAVPLLSVISGWLTAPSAGHRSYGAYVRNKVKVLLTPMAAWNLITLFVLGVAVLAVHFPIDFSPLGMRLVNEVLNLTKQASFNYQMSFLRDIFVCMLMAPLLLRAPTRLLWVVIALAFVWAIGEWKLYLLLRPQILAFFTLGIVARRGDVGETLRHIPSLVLVAAFVVVALAKVWISMQGEVFHRAHPLETGVIDNLLRVAAAAFFWRMALWLADSRARKPLLAVQRYIFITFCVHIMILKLVVGPLQALFLGRFGDPLWLVSFILQPLIALAGAWLISQVLLRLFPALAGVLGGGRLTRPGKNEGAQP